MSPMSNHGWRLNLNHMSTSITIPVLILTGPQTCIRMLSHIESVPYGRMLGKNARSMVTCMLSVLQCTLTDHSLLRDIQYVSTTGGVRSACGVAYICTASYGEKNGAKYHTALPPIYPLIHHHVLNGISSTGPLQRPEF